MIYLIKLKKIKKTRKIESIYQNKFLNICKYKKIMAPFVAADSYKSNTETMNVASSLFP